MGTLNECPDAVPYQTNAEVWVTGKWYGGSVTVRDGDLAKSIKLKGHRFIVLVALMIQAQDDENHADDDEWASCGFGDPKEIAAIVKRLWRLTLSKHAVVRAIHELRKKLAKLWPNRREGRAWAKRLVETFDPLGYRLSTPVRNTHLRISRDRNRAGDTTDNADNRGTHA